MHLGYRGEETRPDPPDERLSSPVDRGAPDPALIEPDRRRLDRWQLAAVAVVAVGLVVRFAARSELWLDEALSVNIARLPLGDIADALRHDGSPPLYYLLLHGWTEVFGTGTFAVRVLSGLFAVAVLPLIWVAGRRVGGRRTAHTALILMAASPFAVRYATEARMYSMLMVLGLAGWLLFDDLLKRFSWARAGGLALLTGAALLTHYWSVYVLVVAAGAAWWRARRGPRRAEAVRLLAALGAGCVLFLPWAPSFLYQLRHTGTPWAGPAGVRVLFDTVFQFMGGLWDPSFVLGLLAWGLIALALFGRAVDGHRVELDFRTRPQGRAVAVAAFASLAVGVVVGAAAQSAFAVRYTAVLFPFVVLLVALGTNVFLDPRVYRGVLAVAVVLGAVAIGRGVFLERTTAPKVARILAASAQPGDVVAYCPDQLGPSVSRLLDDRGLVQLTFPTAGPPDRVDWVDYGSRNRAARAAPFAQLLLERAGPDGTIWLVWSPGYKTFGTKCSAMAEVLEEARPDTTRRVKVSTRYLEHPGLIQFEPGRG